MRPILLELDFLGMHVVLGSYRTLLVAGAIATIVLVILIARYRGLPVRKVAVFALLTALAIPIGARLLHALTNPAVYAEEPSLLWQLSFVNFALYGGLILAAVTSVIAARLLRLNLWRTLDSVAPALGVGIIFARLGCFLNGCCFGIPCAPAFGMVFPTLSGVHLSQIALGQADLFGAPLPVYPTQIYELTGALLGTAIAALLIRWRAPDGVAFLAFAITFTTTRWIVRPLRVIPESYASGELLYALFYGGIIALCAALIVWRFARARAGTRITEPIERT